MGWSHSSQGVPAPLSCSSLERSSGHTKVLYSFQHHWESKEIIKLSYHTRVQGWEVGKRPFSQRKTGPFLCHQKMGCWENSSPTSNTSHPTPTAHTQTPIHKCTLPAIFMSKLSTLFLPLLSPLSTPPPRASALCVCAVCAGVYLMDTPRGRRQVLLIHRSALFP